MLLDDTLEGDDGLGSVEIEQRIGESPLARREAGGGTVSYEANPVIFQREFDVVEVESHDRAGPGKILARGQQEEVFRKVLFGLRIFAAAAVRWGVDGAVWGSSW